MDHIIDQLFKLAIECMTSGNRPMPAIVAKDYLPLGNRTIQITGPIREEDALEIATQYNWQLNAI